VLASINASDNVLGSGMVLGVMRIEDKSTVHWARVFDLHCLGSASCLASAGGSLYGLFLRPMESFWEYRTLLQNDGR
jgi:hypothetical protein